MGDVVNLHKEFAAYNLGARARTRIVPLDVLSGNYLDSAIPIAS